MDFSKLTDSQLAALQITLQYSLGSNHFPQYQTEQWALLQLIKQYLESRQ